MIVLITNNFEPFIVEETGTSCSPMPCVYNEADIYFVPDGWQDELTNRDINFVPAPTTEISFKQSEI